MRREVIRVLTPGTATAGSLVEAKENNFLAAVARQTAVAAAAGASARRSAGAAETAIGLAFVDLSTGEFRATEFAGEKAEHRLRDELGILRPREILLPRPATLFPTGACCRHEWARSGRDPARRLGFRDQLCDIGLLKEQFRVVALDGFGLSEHPLASAAAGAVVHYLRETSAIGARKPEDTVGRPFAASRGHGPRAPGPDHLLRAAGRDDSRPGDGAEPGTGRACFG